MRRVPLFPLPLVLLPGATIPLHIFEPRYRRMLVDVQAADGRFAIVRKPEGVEEGELPAGTVACVARIGDVQQLPDGRANILVSGDRRVRVERVLDDAAPYLVAEVESYDDVPEDPASLHAVDGTVRELFTRVAEAARTIADDRDPPPVLPPEPESLAFAIGSLVDIDLDDRQALLDSRSALARLKAMERLLANVVDRIERRAATHEKAKSNGKGPYPH